MGTETVRCTVQVFIEASQNLMIICRQQAQSIVVINIFTYNFFFMVGRHVVLYGISYRRTRIVLEFIVLNSSLMGKVAWFCIV